jgi:hypothetical protein
MRVSLDVATEKFVSGGRCGDVDGLPIRPELAKLISD